MVLSPTFPISRARFSVGKPACGARLTTNTPNQESFGYGQALSQKDFGIQRSAQLLSETLQAGWPSMADGSEDEVFHSVP